MRTQIVRHRDLEAYKKGFAVAMHIFELSKTFPKDEILSIIVGMINGAGKWLLSSRGE